MGVRILSKITAALIGAGGRGMYIYADYALRHPNDIEFVAVAEPDNERRERFIGLHSIDKAMSFNSWEELFEKPKLADVVFICTQDRMHFEPAMKAFEKGYHIMLEKPMSHDPIECYRIGEAAKNYEKIFAISHVLRYTQFFSEIKKILDEKKLGKVVSIQLNENVEHIHYSNSYVRGNWRNSNESGPMILTKSCHDLDILLWLADAKCEKISSFGSLVHFKKENAPKSAPEFCMDGCPEENSCPYYAPKIYLSNNPKHKYHQDLISPDFATRMERLKTGQFGKCVYMCDNNVVDNQSVNMEFSNGVTALFEMCAFTLKSSRWIKIMGTQAELMGDMIENSIVIKYLATGKTETIDLMSPQDGHGGGDDALMQDFIDLIKKGKSKSLSSAENSVASHLLAFAAEKSRVTGNTIVINDYIKEF